ncbi:flagellar hook-associated protein 1 FlgK [Hypnocyclicus thermotrophus]|uniref:Flagellar hook-associated protein 1 n=1 Tax=Hypnocyclicus thermotrophus TaxID=1627895 RepID=A0AA46DXH3_9FUSO|nr:flagellar hook-associated protein FlgK [Hypnocyclicus thermotrophus]TDT68075.1 flagellar hook-associated protein 1 FlgK [Hypnocyclicus thermotrophus]
MFNSLEIGKRSLVSHKLAMDTTGHNISNANKEGYSRQMVDMETVSMQDPRYGRVGIGSEVETIKRVRDSFIDDRIMKEKSESGKWETKELNLKHMEYIINEPSEQSIRNTLDEYWGAMQELSKNPEDMAIRANVKERAEELATAISTSYERFQALQTSFDGDIESTVTSINSYLKRLAEINSQIQRAEAGGQNANDLRDEFDLLTEELSKIVSIKVIRKDGENVVSLGGRVVVQKDQYKEITVKRDSKINNGMAQLLWADLEEPVRVENGNLKGLIDLRDKESVKYMKYLDELAIGIIDTTNEMNRAGFDLKGRKGQDFFEDFSTYPLIRDINNDGGNEALVYKLSGTKEIAELKKPLSEVLKIETQTTDANGNTVTTNAPFEEEGFFEINGVRISYNTSQDSLTDIIEEINKSKAGVVASAGPNGKLKLRALKDEDYYIKTLNQKSGTLLNKLGILSTENADFDFRKADSISSLSQEITGQPREGAAFRMRFAIENVDEIAASIGVDSDGDGIPDSPGNEGDGRNALRIASLKDKKSIGDFTYAEFFKSVISDLGVSSQEAKKFMKNQKVMIDNLEKRREAVVGVSLDEEMANMIKYQHGYDAAAKYITTVNEMMDTLINKL